MAVVGELMIRAGIDIADVVTGAAAIGKELDGISAAVEKNFAGIDRIGARMKDFGIGLTAAITLPLAGIAAASLNLAAGFEAGMNKVQALGDITGQALKDLEAQAIDLGAKTKFSAKEAADGMGELAAAGLNALQIAKAMPAVLDLASSGEMAVGASASVAANLMGEFGIKAEDLGHAVDVIAKAAASGSQSVSDMSVTLKYVGPVAKAAGISFTETAAAITELANAGIKGSSAGTSLRAIIASLESPSKKAAAVIQQYGLDLKDASGNMKSIADIMDQVNKKGLTVADTFKLVGREPAAAFLALKNAGGDALRSLTKDLENSDGAAKKMADTLNSGLKGAFERAKGSIETLGIVIGKALEPVAIQLAAFVENAGNKLAEWATAFGKLPIGVQEAALAFAALAAAAGPALLIVGAMAQGFVAVSAVVAPFLATLLEVGPAIAAAFAGFSIEPLVAGFAAAATSVGEFSLALLGGAAASIGAFFTVTIPAAGAAMIEFATTAIPAAIAAVVEFATISIPAAIAGMGSFATTTIPAATASLITFATEGIGAAVAGISSLATAAIPALLGTLATLAVAASAAAAAFAGWKLGEWLYSNVAAVKAFGDAVADMILKIPGLKAAIDYFSGASAATAAALAEQNFTIGKLEASLKAHGVTVEKAGLSEEQYGAKLRAALKNYQDTGVAVDEQKNKLASLSKQLGTTGDEHTKAAAKAEAGAKKASDAYKKAGEDITKAFSDIGVPAVDRFTKPIDAIIASMAVLEKAYQAGRVSVEQYAQASAVALQKSNDIVKESYEKALGYLHSKALEPIEVNWKLQDLGPVAATMIDRVAVTMPKLTVPISVLFPPESSAAVKEASKDVLAIDDALKAVGIDQAKMNEAVRASAGAYATLQAAADKGTISQRLADEAHVKSLQAVIDQMQKMGDEYDEDGVSLDAYKAKLEGLKDSLDGVSKKTKETTKEAVTLADEWGKFATDVGTAFSKSLDGAFNELLHGRIPNLKSAFSSLWDDVAKAFTKQLISPITTALGTFLAKGLTGLVTGNGLGGFNLGTITDVFKLGKTVTSVATPAANVAKDVTGAVASGISSTLSMVTGLAGIGIQAAAGIVAGVQAAHANALLDKIEKSTREMSTVMWQTGAESIQGLTKDLRNIALQINDRIIDVRSALFDPVAKDLEDIYKLLQSGAAIATSTTDAVQANTDATNATTNAVTNAANTAAVTGEVQFGATNEIADAVDVNTDYTNAGFAESSNAIAETVSASGSDVVEAVQTGSSEMVQATGQSTADIVSQLANLGSDMVAVGTANGNAYSDLKTQLIGVKQDVDKAMLPGAGSKAMNDSVFGKADEAARRLMLGLDNPNDWVTRSGDPENNYKGPTQITRDTPLAGINVPVNNNPLVSPGFSFTPTYGYVLPSEFTTPPLMGNSAAYSRTTKAPIQYAEQGNTAPIVFNYNGPGDKEYAKQIFQTFAGELSNDRGY